METIRCRVNPKHWWLVPSSILAAGFFIYGPFQIAQEAPKSSPWPLFFLFGPIAVFFLGGAMYGTVSLLREQIIASELGLRWRGAFGPWKSAQWNEVSDFYLSGKPTRISPVQTSPSLTRPIVETPHGKLKIERAFTRLEELLPLIAMRATNAPVREWEIFELRALQGFSQRFTYWTKTQIWTAPSILGLLGVAALLQILGSYFSPQPRASTPPLGTLLDTSWPLFWLPLLLFIALFAPLGGMCIWSFWTMWRERNFASRHRNEHLEISLRGVLWSDGQTVIHAEWNQVRAIHFVPGNRLSAHYRVETQNGDFSVWRTLETLSYWLQLVNQFAPHLAPPPLHPTNQPLGGESSTWSRGAIGKGARIFHFRTSETRAMLWIPTFFTPILPLPYFFDHAMKTPDDLPVGPIPIGVWLAFLAAILVTIGCWILFSRAAIWADETGLEWRFPFLKLRHIEWNEIESFGRDETGVFVSAHGHKMQLWLGFAPAQQEELLQLIAQRATNATGKWD